MTYFFDTQFLLVLYDNAPHQHMINYINQISLSFTRASKDGSRIDSYLIGINRDMLSVEF